jgi:hypothetical protein
MNPAEIDCQNSPSSSARFLFPLPAPTNFAFISETRWNNTRFAFSRDVRGDAFCKLISFSRPKPRTTQLGANKELNNVAVE